MSSESSACAVRAELVSPGNRSALRARRMIRVRRSELKLKVVLSGNGSRIIVTESKAIARSVFASLNKVGGGVVTVSVASLLFALPKAFDTTQRNLAPLSARATVGIE